MSLSEIKPIVLANVVFKYLEAKDIHPNDVAKALGINSFSYEDIVKRNIKFSEEELIILAGLLGTSTRSFKHNQIFYNDRRWC